MVTTVTARPNYYELLGLSPTASQDDLFAAFRKAMGLFAARPAASAAQLSVAFETLRNPAKRRAYDEAQGLNRKPEIPVRSQPIGAAFIGSASHEAAVQALRDRLARLAAPAEQPAPPEAVVEPAVVEPAPPSFIASSVRGAGEPWPAPVRDSAPIQPKLEREIPREREAPIGIANPVVTDAADGSPIAWRRPAVIAGGLVAAAGLIGAFAGISVRDNPPPEAVKSDVTIPLPAARPAAAEVAPASASPVDSWIRPQTASPRVAPQSAHRLRPVLEHHVVVAETTPADPPPPLETAVADSTTTTPVVQTASASMPLPNTVVARTLERIGYSCGSVASASAVEGAPGVYKVTCSSGHSYQASPVRGRYHFRRLGRP